MSADETLSDEEKREFAEFMASGLTEAMHAMDVAVADFISKRYDNPVGAVALTYVALRYELLKTRTFLERHNIDMGPVQNLVDVLTPAWMEELKDMPTMSSPKDEADA